MTARSLMRIEKGLRWIGAGFVAWTLLSVPVSAEESYQDGVKVETQRLGKIMEACKPAAKKTCADKFVETCSERRRWTTVAMMLCHEAAYRHWDSELNRVYKQVMGRAEGVFKKAVRDAQRKWLAYKDARCGVYGHFEGTMWRPVAVACAADMTLRRVGDLAEIRDVGPLKPAAPAAPPNIIWDTDTTVFLDFNCDGAKDQAIFGLSGKSKTQEGAVGWIDGKTTGLGPQFIFAVPVGGLTQYALCGTDVRLEVVTGEKGACPVLRVDDGKCDALFVHHDAKRGAWVLNRN